MKSDQRRKANRKLIQEHLTEIRCLIGEALMHSDMSLRAPEVDSQDNYMLWIERREQFLRLRKKMRSAGLVDRLDVVTPKGLELMR